MRQGIVLVLSAPSGTGKSTLSEMLLKEFPNLGYSVSCTTRQARAGEIDGVHYHFLGMDDFENKRKNGEFAEWAQVHGNFYGTPLLPLKKMLSAGRDVLFDIDVQGAVQIKKSLPEATFAFILPPSMEELGRRLHKRGLDNEETIFQRLANAKKEIAEAYWYDALVVNDDLARAYNDLRSFYIASTLMPSHNKSLVEALLGEK